MRRRTRFGSDNQCKAPPGTSIELQSQLANSSASEPLTVTVAEFCRLTGLGRTSAFKAIRAGDLRSTVVCGRRLIVWASVKALIENNAS
jgi:hypothetical protein